MINLPPSHLRDVFSEKFVQGLQVVQQWSGYAVRSFQKIPQVFAEHPNALIATIAVANTLFLFLLSFGINRLGKPHSEGSQTNFKVVVITETVGFAAVCAFNFMLSKATQAQLNLKVIVAIGISSLVLRRVFIHLKPLLGRNDQKNASPQHATPLKDDEVLDKEPTGKTGTETPVKTATAADQSSPEKSNRDVLVLESELANIRLDHYDLVDKKEKLELSLEEEQDAHHAAKQQFKTLEGQLNLELDALKLEKQQLHSDLEEAAKNHLSQEEKLETEKKSLQDRINSLDTENDEEKNMSNQAQGQYTDALEAQKQAKKERDAAIAERDEAKRKNGIYLVNHTKLKMEKGLLHNRIGELEKEIEALTLSKSQKTVPLPVSPVQVLRSSSKMRTRRRRLSDPSNTASPAKKAAVKDRGSPSSFGDKYFF